MFATVDPRSSSSVPAARSDSATEDLASPAFDPSDPTSPITNRKVAAAYVASVCFKHGPPRRLGTELEWLVRDTVRPARRLDCAALVRALGPYAPPMLRDPGDRPVDAAAADTPGPVESPTTVGTPTLPRGSSVTVEPGGQVEIASPPLDSLPALLEAVAADLDVIRERLESQGLTLVRRAGDPLRPPRRILDVPRYAAMEASFDRIGPYGRTMMCSTSAVQVCLDAGEGSEVTRRWAALHELGPVLTAAFANSPAVHGRRTGWKSSRMASWLALDPERTRPPASTGPDPAAEYADRALATALLGRRGNTPSPVPGCVSFGDWIDGALQPAPTRADLDYHLTTLFPPVRPQGHLEVRYLDQQPGDEWVVPIAVVAALFSDPATLDRARAAAAPAVGRWAAAARHGLDDRVLRRAAGELFELAHRVLRSPAFADLDPRVRGLVDHAIGERVLRGRCPADLDVSEPGEHDLGPPSAMWSVMDPPVAAPSLSTPGAHDGRPPNPSNDPDPTENSGGTGRPADPTTYEGGDQS